MELVQNIINIGSEIEIEEEIFKIFIIGEEGELIFPNDILFTDIDENIQMMFSNFMIALQNFAKNLGDGEVSAFQIGDEKIYSKKDPYNNVTYIYKTDKKVKEKKVSNLLNKVRNAYIHQLIGTQYSSKEKKVRMMKRFILELEEILEEKNKVNNFLKCL